MRDYIREQPDNLKSFNLVKDVANYLGEVYTNIDSESIEVVTQVIESLNEFAMGNVDNQMVLFDSKAMDVVNQLMRQPASNFVNCQPAEAAELKLKAITIVKTMLEDNSLAALKLAKQILSSLDLEAVYENMVCDTSRSFSSFFSDLKKKKPNKQLIFLFLFLFLFLFSSLLAHLRLK